MSSKKQQKKVNEVAGEVIKNLIEFCVNESIVNPKITMDATVSDGAKYRLVFERIDLD